MMSMMTSQSDWSFIDEYVNFMSDLTDAPDVFQRAAALFLISTFAGRKFAIVTSQESKFFSTDVQTGKNLNLWFIIIGKTRLARKSTVVGRVEEFIEAIDPSIKLSQGFTPPALVKDLAERSDPTGTKAAWIHDEISGFFEQLHKAEFMATADTVLSRLYDCKDYTTSTIARGEAVIKKPYLTTFLASTDYLPSLFSENQIRQGFLNRFIFVNGERTRHLEIVEQLSEHHKNMAQRISDWLRALYEAPVRTFVMHANAKKIYNAFEAEIERKISENYDNLEAGYMGNIPNIAYRIAAIHALSRCESDELLYPNGAFIQINVENVEWAISYSSECLENFMKVLEIMKTSATSHDTFTDEKKLLRIYNIIAKEGTITRTDLYNKAKLLARELEEVLNTLVIQNKITITKTESSTKPTLAYKLFNPPIE